MTTNTGTRAGSSTGIDGPHPATSEGERNMDSSSPPPETEDAVLDACTCGPLAPGAGAVGDNLPLLGATKPGVEVTVPELARRCGLGNTFALAVFFGVLALAALPALADDDAEANRMMVEAVGLIGAAEKEPSAEERFRLLRRAHELLTEIVERLPSTDLAVKLATGQRIGTVSLAEVREAMRRARAGGSAAPSAPARPGAPVHLWRHREAVVAAAWSANGGRVSAVSRDGAAVSRDMATGAELRRWRHRGGGGVAAAALSADGRRMLVASADGVAALYDTATAEVLARWQHDRRPEAVALFPRGRRAVVGLRSFVLLVDIGTLEVRHTWRHRAPVVSVALSPDGRRVLMGLAGGDGVLGDTATGAALRTWEHPGSGGGGLMAAAFSPDGRRVLAGAANQAAVLRDVRSGKLLHRWRTGYRVRSVAYSPSGRWVLTGDEGYEAELHEVETGRTLRKWRYDAPPEALAFSPDERRVLMGFADGAVIVCDLRLPRKKRRYVRTTLTPDGGCW